MAKVAVGHARLTVERLAELVAHRTPFADTGPYFVAVLPVTRQHAGHHRCGCSRRRRRHRDGVRRQGDRYGDVSGTSDDDDDDGGGGGGRDGLLAVVHRRPRRNGVGHGGGNGRGFFAVVHRRPRRNGVGGERR